MGTLAELDPIVQSIPGELSYLHGPSGPHRRITMSGSIAPYPDAEAIRRSLNLYGDPFARGRAAGNLAAVYTCRGQLEDAFQAAKESLDAFYKAVADPMNYGLEDLALAGLVRGLYNKSLILYRAGDVGQNHEYARQNREFAIENLAEMRVRDEKWEFLNAAIESLATGQKRRAIAPSAEESAHLQLVESSLRDRAKHHTNTISFPATDPPEIEVLVHASMVHDFIAVEVDQEILAILPAQARERISLMAAGLERGEGFTYTLEIPFVEGACGATSGDAMTLRGSSIANTIALDDARNRTFAGFGPDTGTGSRLLRSLLD